MHDNMFRSANQGLCFSPFSAFATAKDGMCVVLNFPDTCQGKSYPKDLLFNCFNLCTQRIRHNKELCAFRIHNTKTEAISKMLKKAFHSVFTVKNVVYFVCFTTLVVNEISDKQ